MKTTMKIFSIRSEGDHVTTDFHTHQKIYRELFLELVRKKPLYEILEYWSLVTYLRNPNKINGSAGDHFDFRVVSTGH